MRAMMPSSPALRQMAAGAVVCALAVGVGVARDAGASSAERCAAQPRCEAALAAKHKRLCVRDKCVTIAADTRAEILYVTDRRKGKYFVGTFGLWRPTGHRAELERDEQPENVYYEPRKGKTLALAGRYVAFATDGCPNEKGGPGCGDDLTRLNIKTGRRTSHEEGAVDDLAATPKGAVAWIEEPLKMTSPQTTERGTPEVRVASGPKSLANPTLLASSATIEAHSLALDDHHLYWTEGGQPREAVIE